MPRKRTAIVVTTIFEPAFLDGYAQNLREYDQSDTEIIVIIDRKTPATVAAKCHELSAAGHRVLCPTLDEQESFLARVSPMRGRIPYDSDNRRNIGFLMALERGAELLISIDDDNYCPEGRDFVGDHSVAGDTLSAGAVDGSDGWFNICSLLQTSTLDPTFPRGFPYEARRRSRSVTESPATARVAINVGLWTGDPDVDAISRLGQAPQVESYTGHAELLLGAGTWTPINTQNTAVVREAIVAYYYVRMGFPLSGMRIDRYGDILSGYFLQKCVKARGDGILIGHPVAHHRRTPHNLFKDLYHELAGMVIIEDLLPALIETRVDGSDYGQLYLSLAERLDEIAPKQKGFIWDEGGRDFIHDTTSNMRAWVSAVALLS